MQVAEDVMDTMGEGADRACTGHAVVLEMSWLMMVPQTPFFWLVMCIFVFVAVSRVGNGAVLGMIVWVWS